MIIGGSKYLLVNCRKLLIFSIGVMSKKADFDPSSCETDLDFVKNKNGNYTKFSCHF